MENNKSDHRRTDRRKLGVTPQKGYIYTHLFWSITVNPRSSTKWFNIFVYLWRELRVNPKRVLFSFQNVPLVERGQLAGGFTIQISSSGKIPLQKVFLQSACFRRGLSLTAMDVNKRAAVELRTGAYLSSRDHIRYSRLPSATIQDLALFGDPSISGLIGNKFIVGINAAFSPYLTRYSLYCSVVISVNTSRLSKPSYSSS